MFSQGVSCHIHCFTKDNLKNNTHVYDLQVLRYENKISINRVFGFLQNFQRLGMNRQANLWQLQAGKPAWRPNTFTISD